MTNHLRRLLAGAALFLTEFALVVLVGVLGVAGFLYISREVLDQHAAPFDEAAFRWTQQFFGQKRQQWVEAVTFLASRNFIVAASLALIGWFLVLRRHRWYTLMVPVVALGGICLNLVLKNIYQRPRPLLPLTSASGLSFPSGHAMISACFYGLLIYLVSTHVRQHRGLRVALMVGLSLLILLIGATRVYLRVHYATDVLAGFLAGITWLLIAIPLIRRLEKMIRRRFQRSPQLVEKQAQ
ncbi:phosphatase PAP2 family protein [Hymenobacter guriensis]|uniref:Phosphatase PAP2 family protein n=1 Tax=Hymenobacter guriensis TaxID=2793065 RepID=A0ABS0KX16_9BACT|nr:phosphatase PAP2 family protein [Hymenobacter guriensis]MBG8552409.1 phosphatase PAP2 family protein [Hymenobacter guriensis]